MNKKLLIALLLVVSSQALALPTLKEAQNPVTYALTVAAVEVEGKLQEQKTQRALKTFCILAALEAGCFTVNKARGFWNTRRSTKTETLEEVAPTAAE